MRILHTMLRVGDLERSMRFYCDVMGMRVLRRTDLLNRVPILTPRLRFAGL